MNERMIVGTGTLESEWQAWPGLGQLQQTTMLELVPHSARTVIISPHPDDEVLATGGLLAMLAGDARETCVLAVTDGEASHPGSAQWPGHLLTRQRRGESLAGLELLGLLPGSRTTLGLPDGQVQAHREDIVAWLGDFLRPDDVVISTWELDGHPDHEASAQATAKACARTGARHIQVPVWMWHWASPGDTRVPWRRMVRLCLPTDATDRKKLAIAAHRTQLEPQDSGRAPVLGSVVLARMLRPFEVFILPE